LEFGRSEETKNFIDFGIYSKIKISKIMQISLSDHFSFEDLPTYTSFAIDGKENMYKDCFLFTPFCIDSTCFLNPRLFSNTPRQNSRDPKSSNAGNFQVFQVPFT